jgi:hypothetical protein
MLRAEWVSSPSAIAKGGKGPSAVPYGGNFAPPCEMAGGTTWRFLLIPPGYFWQYNLEGSTFDNTITQRIIFVKNRKRGDVTDEPTANSYTICIYLTRWRG